MRFVNTKRFSPVIHFGDLPHEDDYFHERPDVCTREYLEGEEGALHMVDEDWWSIQEERCRKGYTIPNAVEPGGDMLVDGVDAIWSDDGRNVYIPRYDITFYDRKVHITGRHYFYLNFWKIFAMVEDENEDEDDKSFDSSPKDVIPPRFTMLDFFFFRRLNMMFEQGKNGQELKARQLGFSEKIAGGVVGWNFTFWRSSVNVIVAGQGDDSENTFEMCIRGLDHMQNTQFYKERSKTDMGNMYTKARRFNAKIKGLTAKSKPQAVSRLSPTIVIHEEIGKGRKNWSLDVSRFVKPSIMTTGKRTGWELYIGTGGDMDEGGSDLESRHYSPHNYDMLEFDDVFERDAERGDVRVGHFTGKDWFHIIDEDGNPLKERSRKDIARHIETVKPEERHIERSQLAIYASDALMRSTIGYFGEEVISNLLRRKQYIKSHRDEQIVRRGRLVPIDRENLYKGVEWVSDEENGWLQIIEEPELDKDGKPFNNLYEAGTDSYDQDEAHTSDSKGAMFVKKKFRKDSKSPHYLTAVAQLVERPTTAEGGAELFYYHTVLVCIWYNCLNNIEYANLRIFDYYINNGYERFLRERPRIAMAGKIQRTQVSNRYGTDKSLKPHILAIRKDSLSEDAINRMYFIEEIDALSKFIYDPSGKKYNCDITIASSETEVAIKETEMIVVKSRADNIKKTKGIVKYRRVNGELKRVTV